MTLEEKLKELGYSQARWFDTMWKKCYENARQVISLTPQKNKVEDFYIWMLEIKNQKDVDDIQIAFNRLQKDLKELKEYEIN